MNVLGLNDKDSYIEAVKKYGRKWMQTGGMHTMYTKKPHLGKFEGNQSHKLAEAVYKASMEGWGEDLGNVDDFGFYSYVKGKRYHFILSEDSQGFVYVEWGTPDEMADKWTKINLDYQEYCEEIEENEGGQY